MPYFSSSPPFVERGPQDSPSSIVDIAIYGKYDISIEKQLDAISNTQSYH